MTERKRTSYEQNRSFTQEDWDEVSDNPELTDEELANIRPAHEVLPPDLYEALTRKGRGPQKAPTKQLVRLRLDRDVIAHFKAKGVGWQTRINKALRAAMGADAK